ncbi:MAG: YihY/virulence factor BrkB family protein [Terriglobales bacterium]
MSDSILGTEQQIASIWDLGGLTLRELARRVWDGIYQNELLDRGYELAYNFLLAVFPLLLFLITLLGLFASEGSKLQTDLFFYFQEALPPAAYGLIVSTLHEVAQNAGGGKITFGLLFALYFGSGAITQLMSTLNAAYGVRERRSWLKVHLVALGMTIAMSMLIVVALLFVFAGGWLVEMLGRPVGLGSASVVAAGVLQWALALGSMVLCLAVIYYFAPDVEEPRWYWITPGSVVGVLLWAIASAGLRVYLHFFNVYSRTYGSLGAVIILMLWFYITGLAFLVGGQINSTIAHAAAGHSHPAKAAGREAA